MFPPEVRRLVILHIFASNKPKAFQPLAGGYARNERHHRTEKCSIHHPGGMAATPSHGVTRQCWHPSGMRFVVWDVSGGVSRFAGSTTG
jgi:hypothetical protein